jgi:hypothetical protein
MASRGNVATTVEYKDRARVTGGTASALPIDTGPSGRSGAMTTERWEVVGMNGEASPAPDA